MKAVVIRHLSWLSKDLTCNYREQHSEPVAVTSQSEADAFELGAGSPNAAKQSGMRVLLVAFACLGLLAYPADARSTDMRCSSWTKLTEDQKLQTIDGLIEDAISSSADRKYDSFTFKRARISRCLERYRPQLVDDFDELCAQRMRADLQAMNRTFRTYTWSCV
jgi:hypothetical protein